MKKIHRPLNEVELGEFEKGKEIVRQIFNSINNMSRNDPFVDGMLEEIRVEHRTLQQSFFGVVLKIIGVYEEMEREGWYDMRNEASVKLASRFVHDHEDDFYLPFV